MDTKKILLVLLVFLFLAITELYSQAGFEKGFYIDNKKQKVSGLIKNNDWLNEPKQVQFKVNKDAEVRFLSIDDVHFFEVGNFRFQRFTVPFDISYSEKSVPGKEHKPVYKEKKVFLQVLVEGKADLYKLGSENRFYFTINNDSVQHLVYKSFVTENQLRYNSSYKSQIFEAFKCDNISIKDIENLSFGTRELMNLFVKYNECEESNTYVYKNKKKIIFHLSPVVGIRSAKLKVRHERNTSQNVDFSQEWNLVFGLNLEYILPFNKNKWSVFFEPVYQSYTSEVKQSNYKGAADYQSIELHLGLRYYLYLSESSAVFLNASLMNTEIPLNSTINSMEVASTYNFSFGGGYLFKEKISVAAKVASSRNLLRNYVYYSAKYQSYEFVIAYRIF